MLGLDNPLHIVMLLIILLLVFGAKRLPEMGRSLGSGLRGFKESLSGEETGHAGISHTDIGHSDSSHTESSPMAVADTPALAPAPQPVVAAVSPETADVRVSETVGATR